jgi:hypothetical protein
MGDMTLSQEQKAAIKEFFAHTKHPGLVPTYLYFIEKKFALSPVLILKDKVIYQSLDDAIAILGKEGKLWRETEIKIGYVSSAVDELTKKIYICPFTGKVFGDNTNPNPQDAIYEWVAHCKENTERMGGMKVKRFYISEDPEVIKSYAAKCKPKEPITKIVFSSAINGKLFHSKEAVIDDFKAGYIKPMTLLEVQNQNKYQIEKSFMSFIEKQLADDKIAAFVEAMAEVSDFMPHVERWLKEAS